MTDPYQPPQALGARASAPASCPECASPRFEAVTFTWWGGLVGPKLLSHVRCLQCASTFNSKTGRSNSAAIAIYFVVSLAFGLLVLAAVLRRVGA